MNRDDPNPADIARQAERHYRQAIECYQRQAYGEALHLLGQVTKLDPTFDDRDNLRGLIAQALTDQQRDRVFATAASTADTALDQHRWDDIPVIVAGMSEQLEAENLALTDEQQRHVTDWLVRAETRGQQARPTPARGRRQRSTGPALLAERIWGGVATRRRWIRPAAAIGVVLAGLAYIAVINSDDQAEIASSNPNRPAEDQNPDNDQPIVPIESPVPPPGGWTGMDQLDALWWSERQSVLADLRLIDEVGVGTDGLVVGPAGMTVDLSSCPAGWDDTGGIIDGVVHLAYTLPMSGAIADYSGFGRGLAAYFDRVNQQGGIGPDGLAVEVTLYDDSFQGRVAADIVDDLLADDRAFAVTSFGTPTSLIARDRLHDGCVPQPLVQSNYPAWDDPEGRPWTTGLPMSLATEAWLWRYWIDQQFTEPVTVAALVMDNEFGRVYEQNFTRAVEGSRIITEVVFRPHDPVAVAVDGGVAILAQSEPDVFIAMTAGTPCLLTAEAVANTGLSDTATVRIASSACQDAVKTAGAEGAGADGWVSFGGGTVDLLEPSPMDVFSELVQAVMAEEGVDPNDASFAEGFGVHGWALHQVLEVAAALDGGLTRSNLLIAQWGLRDMTHPALFDGIGFGTYGPLGPAFIEGSEVARFDAATGAWVAEDTITGRGAIPPCRWQPEVGCT